MIAKSIYSCLGEWLRYSPQQRAIGLTITPNYHVATVVNIEREGKSEVNKKSVFNRRKCDLFLQIFFIKLVIIINAKSRFKGVMHTGTSIDGFMWHS